MSEYLIYVMNKIKDVVDKNSTSVYYTINRTIVISSFEMDYKIVTNICSVFIGELKNWRMLTFDTSKCYITNDKLDIDIKTYQRSINLKLLLEYTP